LPAASVASAPNVPAITKPAFAPVNWNPTEQPPFAGRRRVCAIGCRDGVEAAAFDHVGRHSADLLRKEEFVRDGTSGDLAFDVEADAQPRRPLARLDLGADPDADDVVLRFGRRGQRGETLEGRSAAQELIGRGRFCRKEFPRDSHRHVCIPPSKSRSSNAMVQSCLRTVNGQHSGSCSSFTGSDFGGGL